MPSYIRLGLEIAKSFYKTLYLTNLESSDVIGGKVEIQADFLSVGKAKAQMAEAIVNRLLTLSSVVSAGWELV